MARRAVGQHARGRRSRPRVASDARADVRAAPERAVRDGRPSRPVPVLRTRHGQRVLPRRCLRPFHRRRRFDRSVERDRRPLRRQAGTGPVFAISAHAPAALRASPAALRARPCAAAGDGVELPQDDPPALPRDRRRLQRIHVLHARRGAVHGSAPCGQRLGRHAERRADRAAAARAGCAGARSRSGEAQAELPSRRS